MFDIHIKIWLQLTWCDHPDMFMEHNCFSSCFTKAVALTWFENFIKLNKNRISEIKTIHRSKRELDQEILKAEVL